MSPEPDSLNPEELGASSSMQGVTGSYIGGDAAITIHKYDQRSFIQNYPVDGSATIQQRLHSLRGMPNRPPICYSSAYKQRHTSFTGRLLELEKLHKQMTEKYAPPLVIAGISGLGKTALAYIYAIRYREHYEGPVFFINAGSGNIEAQFFECANEYAEDAQGPDLPPGGYAEIKQFFKHYLDGHNHKPKALLVLDDAFPTVEFKSFLSSLWDFRYQGVRILVTTQFPNLDARLEKLYLSRLSHDDALQLLAKLVRGIGESLESESQKKVAKSISVKAGYLPFYLRGVRGYLSKKRHDSLGQLRDKLTSSFPPATTMELKGAPHDRFDRIWQELDDNNHRLGKLISFFFTGHIPTKLIDLVAQEAGLQPSAIERAKDRLVQYFLVELGQDKQFWDVAPPVFSFLVSKRREDSDELNLKAAYIKALCKFSTYFVPDFTASDLQKLAPTVPHLEALLLPEQLHDVPDDYLRPLFRSVIYFYLNRGIVYGSEDALNKALKHAESANCVLKDRLGENHLSFIMNLNAIAYICTQQNRFQDAESYYMSAVAHIVEIFGKSCLDLVESYNGLGYLYEKQNILEKAEEFYLKALALIDDHLLDGESNEKKNIEPKYIETLTNLGNITYAMDHPEQSLEHYEKALELSIHLFREDDREIPLYKNYIANVYTRLGRLDEAEALYLEAIENTEQHFGEDHPSLAISFNNLAMVYHLQKDFAGARKYYEKDIEITKRLNENHPDVAVSLNNLAAVCVAEQNYDEAEEKYKDSISRGKKQLPDGHPDLVTRQRNLAKMYLQQKRIKKAKQCYKEALQGLKGRSSAESASGKLDLQLDTLRSEFSELNKFINWRRTYRYFLFFSLAAIPVVLTLLIHTSNIYLLSPLVFVLVIAVLSSWNIYQARL